MFEVSVILPTYNEAENIPLIVKKLETVLKKFNYEILIVDDNSPDKTYDIAVRLGENNKRIRAIRRVHERGLSSAIVAGFANANGKYRIVMDADMQHDEKVLPLFIEKFREGYDLVIGTRRAEGGGTKNWSWIRRFISRVASLMARIILVKKSTDPGSGFFGVSKEYFEKSKDKLNPRGFKILLEFLALDDKAKMAEVGYVFLPRIYGTSKLSTKVVLEFLIALYELRIGKVISLEFIKYSMVGLSGVAVNLVFQFIGENYIFKALALKPFLSFSGSGTALLSHISRSQVAVALAIEISIFWNFILNNWWTFKNYKISGFWKLIRGFIVFNFVCLAGALINLSVFSIAMEKLSMNIYVANLTGIIFATMWNYLINVQTTWNEKRKA